MKKLIALLAVALVAACTHYSYHPREELVAYPIMNTRLKKYDISLGVEFVNKVSSAQRKHIEGDLAGELATWFVMELEEEGHFSNVVNLNIDESKMGEVDVILRGIIKSILLHDPGVSTTSKVLGIFYGIAPVTEHYLFQKDIAATSTIKFQLLDAKDRKLIWETSIIETSTKSVTLAKATRVAISSLAKVIESLVVESQLAQELEKIHKQRFMAKVPEQKWQTAPIQPTWMLESTNRALQKWAVVIGISNYKILGQTGLANLIFADDDARAFARTLKNLRWSNSHIKLILNKQATKRNIEIALESWLSKAGPNDQIILFWAGHGFPDPEDPEKVYFACHDTDISIPATGCRMDRVRAILEERKAKNVIVLADTCHAGKLITRGHESRGISILPNINKMVRERKVPKGWIFMVGADTDRQAIEHTSWANGAFTYSLIKGLNGEADGFQSAGAKDGVVTMGELKAYMNTAMPDETQKILGVAKRPVIATSTGDPDIWNLTFQVTK
ncbi:MAG: caspase family protein [Desulfobacteraceae bacterium]|nr:caspase family protein [Desulfobacteraceae bacterium]